MLAFSWPLRWAHALVTQSDTQGHPGTYAGVSVCIKRVFTVRALDTEWPHSALSLSAQSSRAAWLGPSSAGLARAGCWAITGFTLHTLISTEQKNTQDTPASQGLHMECKHAQTFILSTKQITCLEFARKIVVLNHRQ